MPTPVTPLVGVDVFVLDAESRVLLIRRTDNGLWATPGGYQDLGETPRECGVREVFEETGFEVRVTRLLGVFSSQRYQSVNSPWKDREITHVLFEGEVAGGTARTSEESSEVEWFARDGLPPLSDGHAQRIGVGFDAHGDPSLAPHFE